MCYNRYTPVMWRRTKWVLLCCWVACGRGELTAAVLHGWYCWGEKEREASEGFCAQQDGSRSPERNLQLTVRGQGLWGWRRSFKFLACFGGVGVHQRLFLHGSLKREGKGESFPYKRSMMITQHYCRQQRSPVAGAELAGTREVG